MNDIVEHTMRQVEEFFRSTRHRPNDAMMDGLSAIPRIVGEIIEGKADRKFHVIDLDCGIGKSTALRFAIKAAREIYDDVGTLVNLHRHDDIADYVENLGLEPGEYAFYTSRQGYTRLEAKGLERGDPTTAPVLLTTQSMLDRRVKEHRDFGEIEEFWYKGKRRKLIVWDEALQPDTERVLNLDRLTRMRAVAGPARKELIDVLLTALYNPMVKDQETITVPDDVGAATADEFARGFKLRRYDRVRDDVDALYHMLGMVATVSKQGNSRAALHWAPGLPEDIRPILVLDASARLRSSLYKLRATTVGDTIVHGNHAAQKFYNNVTIHMSQRSGGKSAYAAEFPLLLKDVAHLVATIEPHRKIALVYPKVGVQVSKDLYQELQEVVSPEELARVKPVTWGRHTASNKFRDCDAVIVASLFYLPSYAAEARLRAFERRDMEVSVASTEREAVRNAVRDSELFQACSRGSLRYCRGNQALPCDLYVVTGSTKEGREGWLGRRVMAALAEMFPGAKGVEGWTKGEPVPLELLVQSKHQRALRIIGEYVQVKPSTVADRLGVNRGNFTNRYLRNKEFSDALATMGYSLHRVYGSRKLIVLAPDFPVPGQPDPTARQRLDKHVDIYKETTL